MVPQSSAILELTGVRVGRLQGLTVEGAAMVVVDADGAVLTARSCIPLGGEDIGSDVVVFMPADRLDPIVLGVVRRPAPGQSLHVTADGKNVRLTAEESITLECGEARITLHRSGKIVVRGAHVVSHASGVNRIRGGSVLLN